MQLEVERKYRVTEPAALRSRLAEFGVKLGDPQRQQDDYFNHPARDFAVTDEALRIRSIGAENFVTYKGPKLDRIVKTRRELELPIGVGLEAAARFAELLGALGFRLTAQVVKHRSSAAFDWNGTHYEVCWDEVERLGTFVELEMLVEADAAESARERILALEQALGLTTPEPRSYLSMVLAATTTA
jgi:adenylate cyclase class 2